MIKDNSAGESTVDFPLSDHSDYLLQRRMQLQRSAKEPSVQERLQMPGLKLYLSDVCLGVLFLEVVEGRVTEGLVWDKGLEGMWRVM